MKARTLIIMTGAFFALVAPVAHANDVTTVIRPLASHAGKYQVEFENTSGIGYINTLDWVPPNEMTITAITGSQGGTCHLANNMLMCTGGKHKEGLAPPKCTCRHGGVMTVDFTATGDSPTFNGHWWTYYGIWSQTDITSMTPVPYQIPSYQNPQTNFADLPLCDPGTQSTDAHPCHVE